MNVRDEDGFSLVEMLVGIFLLAVLSVGFYQVMLSSVRGSEHTADIARVAEEARLGFNRMIRDTRETTQLVTASSTDYRIWIDFDRDGVVDAADFEYIRYSYDGANERIMLTALTAPVGGDPDLLTGSEATLAGTSAETLASNVRVAGSDPVFEFASNFLQYDTSGDGEVTADELDDITGIGNLDNTINGTELEYISDVNYSFRVVVGDDARTFYGQAQIRNRRYSDL